MKCNVHIYAIVRVKVLGVEANSQEEAIKSVRDHVNLSDLPNRSHPLSLQNFRIVELQRPSEMGALL